MNGKQILDVQEGEDSRQRQSHRVHSARQDFYCMRRRSVLDTGLDVSQTKAGSVLDYAP